MPPESWTVRQRDVRQLESFHLQQCVSSILKGDRGRKLEERISSLRVRRMSAYLEEVADKTKVRKDIHTPTHTYTHTQTYIHTHTHTHTPTHTRTRTNTHSHTPTNIHIHTRTNTHTHTDKTHTHTHTHTHKAGVERTDERTRGFKDNDITSQ